MIVRLAREQDLPGFLHLAAQVEYWFGPMVGDPGFHGVVAKHIRRSTTLVAVSSGSDVLGCLLFGAKSPTYHVDWLVVSKQVAADEPGCTTGSVALPAQMHQAYSANQTGRSTAWASSHASTSGQR